MEAKLRTRAMRDDCSIQLDEIVSADCTWVSREVFSSDEIYRAEQRKIFERNWLYLAHESQLQKPGDFVSAFMGEIPVIVAKGSDGKIVASINSCPHRGLRVCRSDHGNTSRFVCPYHTWTFKTTGELVGIPQARKTQTKIDKEKLGLRRVPRVETSFGMIFGCLDPDVEPLDDFLGDQRFYLEAFFNAYPGGIEIVGPPHKWQIGCNWKLPVENMLGDIGHAAFLHGALVAPNSDAAVEIEDYALTAVARPGHAAAFRLMPADSAPKDRANINSAMSPELVEYLAENRRTMAERLSPVQSRIKGMAFGIYPNLSVLWGQWTMRISHPRAPGRIEYWSWLMLPREAPDDIRGMLLSQYNSAFGPGGYIEQEDSYAWSRQFEGSDISYMHDTPYYYGLGIGEEYTDPELPGVLGRCFNEHYARAFYRRWKADLGGEVGAA